MSPHLIDQIPSKSRKHSVSSCNLTENTFSCPRLSLEPLGVGGQISQLSLSHAKVTSKLQNVVGLARRSSPSCASSLATLWVRTQGFCFHLSCGSTISTMAFMVGEEIANGLWGEALLCSHVIGRISWPHLRAKGWKLWFSVHLGRSREMHIVR